PTLFPSRRSSDLSTQRGRRRRAPPARRATPAPGTTRTGSALRERGRLRWPWQRQAQVAFAERHLREQQPRLVGREIEAPALEGFGQFEQVARGAAARGMQRQDRGAAG